MRGRRSGPIFVRLFVAGDGKHLVVSRRIAIPLAEFEFTYVRSSGPGGQNVNKVSSKAVLRWDVAGSPSLPDDMRQRFVARHRNRIGVAGEVVIASDRYRDQRRNAADCLARLQAMLSAVATPPKPRRATKPSRAAVQRRLTSKQAHSEKKRLRRPPQRET
jgi:ribosome-associated protein